MAPGCQPLFEPCETSLIVDLRRASALERVMGPTPRRQNDAREDQRAAGPSNIGSQRTADLALLRPATAETGSLGGPATVW